MPKATTPQRTGTQPLPVQTRMAQIMPGTYSAADNTVEVVFSAGSRVPRIDYWTEIRYDEELEVSPQAIDLSRFDAGVVHVLDNHNQSAGVAGVLGVATRAWIANGEARATLLLSKDPAKAGVVADIVGGVIRAVSVGYSVQRYEITLAADRTDGATDLWRATRWTPQEISFVTIPADPAAATRSAPEVGDTNGQPCEFVTRASAAASAISAISPSQPPTRKDGFMPSQVQSAAEQPSTETTTRAAPVAQPEAIFAAVVTADNTAQRAADISALCVRHAVPNLAEGLIRSGADLQYAKDTILNAIAVRDAASGGHQNTRIETVRDETDVRMRGMEDALLSRLLPSHKLDDNARQFRHLSLLEMGREHLEHNGISTRGMDKMRIAGQMLQVRAAGMHTTSDFGFLFSNVAHRRLSAVYAEYPSTYQQWARQAPSLSDFKPLSVVSMGSGPDLLKINEHGEYKYGTFGESAEQYQLATYGRIVAMTRQAIINDDLRGFDRLIASFGSSARRLENKLVYEQLTAGVMGDGKAVFHADHKNLATGAPSALSLDALSAARTKMRMQKGMEGDSLNVSPKYLIVPAALETLAYQLTSNAYTPTAASGVSDFRAGGRTALEVIVEPLLDASSATAWYLAAESALIDTVEFAYLDGANGPVTETREGFEVDGTEVKCRLDFVAKALDWRGLVKSAGA